MSLYLIPTFLSTNHDVLPKAVVEIASLLDEFIVENEKTARAFLKSIGTKHDQKNLIFHLLNEHSTDFDVALLGEILKKKKDIGLMSEAGCPGVADPGAAVVRLAHENGIRVMPLVGPSSILLALMGSGFNGQSFVFHGYLPRDPAQRKNKIREIEKSISKNNQTQIFMEAPYRNQQILNDVLATCTATTLLCIACDLTSSSEKISTRTIDDWRKKVPEINKKPVIFLLGR